MKCGGTNVCREDSLIGSCCDNTEKCECCGDYYDSDDLITLGDETRVCGYCYDEETATDAMTNEQYLFSTLAAVWLYSEDETRHVKSNPIYLYDINKFLSPKYTVLEELRCHNEFPYDYYVKPSDLTAEGLALFDAD